MAQRTWSERIWNVLGIRESVATNFEGIEDFENKGIQYFVKDPKIFNNKNIVISGGGDSALDWVIELSKSAKNITLVHRRNEFRGAKDSVDKVQQLKNLKKINLITPAEVYKLDGDDQLETVYVKKGNEEIKIKATMNKDFLWFQAL